MMDKNIPNVSISTVSSNAIQNNDYQNVENNNIHVDNTIAQHRILYTESPSVWIKIFAALLLVAMYFIMKKCKENFEIDQEQRDEERRRQREAVEEADRIKSDPKRRQSLINMHIDTRKIFPHQPNESDMKGESDILELLMDSDIYQIDNENGEMEMVNQYSSLPSNTKTETLQQQSKHHDDVITTEENVACIPCTTEVTQEEVTQKTLQSHSVCPICLKAFEHGEEISWSKHLVCLHVFHKDCLTPWLMKHDDCPVCRSKMVHNDRIDTVRKPMFGFTSHQLRSGNENEANARYTNVDSLDDNDDCRNIEEGLFILDGMISFERPPRHHHSSPAQCHISDETNQSIPHITDDSSVTKTQEVPVRDDDDEYDEEEAVVTNTLSLNEPQGRV